MVSFLVEDVMHTYPRYRIRELTVDFNHNVPADWRLRNTGLNGDDNDEYAVMFRRFVNVLEGYFRIRTLHLTRANFFHGPRQLQDGNDDNNHNGDGFDPSLVLEDRCLTAFFGEVLPNHLSLRDVTISHSRIQPQYWQLFTENSAGPLVRLALESTPLTTEDCELLQLMLQRQVSLHILSIEDCGLGAGEWELVCEGVADNGEVHTLTLIERNVTVGLSTLLPLFRGTSGVDRLVVHAAAWAEDGSIDGAFGRFVRAMRVENGKFRELTLRRADHEFPHVHWVVDLLTTPDCLLERATFHPAPANDPSWAGRVERARSVVRLFGAEPPHRLAPVALWPLALQGPGEFPSFLYPFLRTRNVEALCEHAHASVVAAGPAAAARENRARDDASATATPTAQMDKKRPHERISE